jgi:AraC-like DNA-binding protein
LNDLGRNINGLFTVFADLTAQTLGDAMSIAAKYVNLVTPLAKVIYRADESYGFLEAEEAVPLGDIKQFCLESWAGCLYTMTVQMLGQAIADFEIEFSFAQPSYVDQYVTFFGKLPQFGCNKNRVSIPKSFLAIPLPLADKSSHQLAIEQCEAQLEMFYGPQSLVDKIKQIITTAPDCQLTMDEIADIFCVTTRTLRRHLKSFDVNYQNILVEVKKERACQLIDENKHSIELIAERVGYQDISNFNRAFKKWTGTTPAKFRQREA